jgi:hypothetical protein
MPSCCGTAGRLLDSTTESTDALWNPRELPTVSEFLLRCQPAHLQKMIGERLDGEHRSIARADYLRRRLASDKLGVQRLHGDVAAWRGRVLELRRVMKRKRPKVTRGSELLRELRQACRRAEGDLVGKPVEEVVKVTRRVRAKLWRERASESPWTRVRLRANRTERERAPADVWDAVARPGAGRDRAPQSLPTV